MTVQKILTEEVTFTFFKNFFNVKEPKQSPQSFFFQLDYRNLKCVMFFLLMVTHHFLSISVTCPSSPEPSFKSEIHSGLPAPPQMPLPEIPHPWLVRLYGNSY